MVEEQARENLQRSKRVTTYMIISLAVWIGVNGYLGFTNDDYQTGTIILGVLAIAFFWLLIQQKIITNTYLVLLKNAWKIIEETDQKMLNALSKDSTDVIDPNELDIDGIPDIKDLSKAKKDEDLV